MMIGTVAWTLFWVVWALVALLGIVALVDFCTEDAGPEDDDEDRGIMDRAGARESHDSKN